MGEYKDSIQRAISNSIKVKQEILADEKLIATIELVAREIILGYRNNKKVLLCGNGGSAADAQHISAELTGRFYKNRPPLFAEALSVNTSYITAVANDFSYDEIFSRLVLAKGEEGDILIGISTSGNSENVVRAVKVANEKGLITVGLTGKDGGKLRNICKYLINVPSNDTPRIQEAHILIGHILCEIIENEIFD
jgi:D-sedoheptulose 7-phosphate isomerase